MPRPPRFTRRSLLAASSLASLRVLPGVAQDNDKFKRDESQEATPAVDSSAAESRLILGGAPDSLGQVTTLGLVDHTGKVLDEIAFPDGVVDLSSTRNPGVVLINSLFGTVHVDLDSGNLTNLDLTGAELAMIAMPQPRLQGPTSAGSTAFIANALSLDAVFMVDYASGETTNVSEQIVASGQPAMPATATFGPGGTLAGVWTGNWVWLVDVNDLDAAIPLYGDDDSMFSTAFNISFDEAWCAYTTYAQSTGKGSVYLQATKDGEPIPVVDGDAWSTIGFIPNDPDRFVLFTAEQAEIREIERPDRAGEVLGPYGAQPRSDTVISTDGNRQLCLAHAGDTDPGVWSLLDFETGTLTKLPDLQALNALFISHWEQAPAYAAFGSRPDPATSEPRPGPVLGFDFATGETFELLDDIALDFAATHSTSADGEHLLLFPAEGSPTEGAWHLNLATREATELPFGTDQQFTVGGGIAGDASLAAITVENASGEESEVLTYDPASPGELSSIGPGSVLGWS